MVVAAVRNIDPKTRKLTQIADTASRVIIDRAL